MIEKLSSCHPAGHLPRKGGDPLDFSTSQISKVAGWAETEKLLISPLAGEMSGRTKGGGKELDLAKSEGDA